MALLAVVVGVLCAAAAFPQASMALSLSGAGIDAFGPMALLRLPQRGLLQTQPASNASNATFIPPWHVLQEGEQMEWNSTLETCLQLQLRQLQLQCSGTLSASVTKLLYLHAGLVRTLLLCVPSPPSWTLDLDKPMRILVIPGAVAQALQMSTDLFNSIVVDSLPPAILEMPQTLEGFMQAFEDSARSAANASASHVAWLVPVLATGDGVALGAFLDLAVFLPTLSPHMQPESLVPAVRASSVYRSKVYTLPLSAHSLLLYYRKDVFQQQGWPVPTTWSDLVSWAQQANGTQGLHSLCLYTGPCPAGMVAPTLLRYILASMTQTKGSSDGWLLDPTSMQLLMGTPAMATTIQILQALLQLSPPDLSVLHPQRCTGASFGFEQGQCLMTLATPLTYKYIAHTSRASVVGPLQGNLGVAQLPGSEVVLDRATNTLQPCDAAACPSATRHVDARGISRLVNRSPGLEVFSFALNGQMAFGRTVLSLGPVAFLVFKEFSDQLVFHPDADVFPIHTNQLSPAAWAAAGYHPDDARAFCAAQSSAYSHANLHTSLRTPGAVLLAGVLAQVVSLATSNISVTQIAATGQAMGSGALAQTVAFAYQGSWASAQADYQDSIGFRNRSAEPPSSPGLGLPGGGSASSSNQHLVLLVTLCVVPPVVALVVLGILLWRRAFKQGSGALKQQHPGISPLTTLLVTDIENSTSLWEQMDSTVLDTALKLHNSCIRKAAAEAQGYESVWEGDSFIIAFHTPQAALAFSLHIQQALLQLDWPPELLQSSFASERWVRPLKTGSQQAQAMLGPPQQNAMAFPAELEAQTAAISQDRLASIRNSLLDDLSRASQQPPAVQQQLGSRLRASRVRFVQHLAGGGSTADDRSSGSSYQSSDPGTIFSSVGGGGSYTGRWRVDRESVASGAGEVLQVHHNRLWDALGSNNGSSPGETPRAGGAEVEVFGARAAPRTTLGASYQSAWNPCAAGTPGALLAYRGLRVRVGMHADLGSGSNQANFNAVMRRYHYTGPIRVLSNAIASAGHGGQTLLSTATAGLLGMDAKGMLQGLPADGLVFYMGRHLVSDADEALDLLCVVPRSLVCRMALQPPELRKAQCLLPGCLAAPLPTQHQPVFLACMQLSGVASLLRWDAQEAQAAVRLARECALEAVARGFGVVAEDGWALDHRTAAGSSAALVVAFTCARAALGYVLDVRSQLLMLDWSEQLLAHSACERVGSTQLHNTDHTAWRALGAAASKLDVMFKLPLQGADAEMAELGAAAIPAGLASPGSPAAHMPDAQLIGTADFPDTSQHADASLAATMSTAGAVSGFEHQQTCRSSQLSVAPHSNGGDEAPLQDAAREGPLGPPATQQPSSSPRSPMHATRPMQTRLSTSALPPALQESQASQNSDKWAALALASRSCQGVGGQSPAVVAAQSPRSFFATSGQRTPTGMVPQPSQTALDSRWRPQQLMVQDPSLLRGLRVKGTVVVGSLRVSVATRASGRAVYHGKAARSLHKLLKQAAAGQVVTTLTVLQAAQK